ncbi:TPA: hypothetical protein ACOENT_001766 [Stenotrophomonas maltophilia]
MKKTGGFSILELMLAMVVVTACSVPVYKLMKVSQVNAQVRSEQKAAGDLAAAIHGAYTVFGDFSTLSTETAAGISRLNVQGNGSLSTKLGTDMTVRPATIFSRYDAFDFVYHALSTRACTALANAMNKRADAVLIGSFNVRKKDGSIDEGALATQCGASDQNTLVIRFGSEKRSGAAIELDPKICAPGVEERTQSCPADMVGSITEKRTITCVSGKPQATSWTVASNTCGRNGDPIAPPTAPEIPGSVCVEQTEVRTTNCGAGSIGSVLEQRSKSCATGQWGAWNEVSNSCQRDPNRKPCTPSTQRQNAACPAGQGGGILQERASTCDANGNEVWSNDWKNISSTCTASCIRDGNCCTVGRREQTVSQPCAQGSFGNTSARQQQTSTCASPTAAPVWQSNWTTISTIGACSACSPDSSTDATQWQERSAECPTGQTGRHTWRAEQVQTTRLVYACNHASGVTHNNATASTTPWADTGRKMDETNTCTAPVSECAVPGSYTITSASIVVRAGVNHRTVNPYTLSQIQSTPGNANADNMEFEGSVMGYFNGQPFHGTVRAAQSTTVRGSGTCYAMQANGNPNAALASCGGGGMPPGLDLSVFMAGNSQGQMSVTTRPCGGGGGSANVTTGNLFVYNAIGFIATGNAPAGQSTLVASAQTSVAVSQGPLRASYANYSISFNGVTRTGLNGSCSVSNLGAAQNCVHEQPVDFNGRTLSIKLIASGQVGTNIDAVAQVYVTPK